MATSIKIDSNITELRIAEESTPKVVSGSATWYPLEPNSYGDFGGEVTTIARETINPSRQRQKGSITDKSANGGFISDLTQKGLMVPMPGLFFADWRRKKEFGVTSGTFTSVATSDDSYNAASGLAIFTAGILVFAAGFSNPTNNGLKYVNTGASGKVTVSTDLVDETPPAGASLVEVGFQFGSGEVNISATGGQYPRLTRASGTKDFTTFGLIPGEYVFVGGDSAGLKFTNAVNNGFCRVRSVAATYIEFDKTASTMTTETGTGKTIQIFFGRVLKNEATTSLIKKKSYQLERTLGYSDDTLPDMQAEYIIGAYANTASISMQSADKVTVDVGFVGLDTEVVDGASATIKSGPRPALSPSELFNTSSTVRKIKLNQVSTTNSNPSALFSYLENVTIEIDNGVTLDKAVGVLGGFAVSIGDFMVKSTMSAYFATVAAITAVQNNQDFTMEVHFVKSNAGISFDMPLLTLGGGKPDVQKNAAVKVPLQLEANSGSKISTTLDHTLLMVVWDYLPSAAG